MANVETMKYLQLRYDATGGTPTGLGAYMSLDGIDWANVATLPFSGNFTTAPDLIGVGADLYTGFSNDPTARIGWNIEDWNLG